MKTYSAIILSGGKGSRMQESVPKQYLLLAGKPVIMHTIERLDRIPALKEIIIVCDASYESMLQEMMNEYNITKPVRYVYGGVTRQESVYNGVCAANTLYVVLHEAARPFVETEVFESLINYDADNVILGYDIPYTVIKGHTNVEGILTRSELINVQLPQKFNCEILKEAHRKALENGNSYTEDASLLFNELNVPIEIIRGKSYNIKITEPVDLLYGEIIFRTYISSRY